MVERSLLISRRRFSHVAANTVSGVAMVESPKGSSIFVCASAPVTQKTMRQKTEITADKHKVIEFEGIGRFSIFFGSKRCRSAVPRRLLLVGDKTRTSGGGTGDRLTSGSTQKVRDKKIIDAFFIQCRTFYYTPRQWYCRGPWCASAQAWLRTTTLRATNANSILAAAKYRAGNPKVI